MLYQFILCYLIPKWEWSRLTMHKRSSFMSHTYPSEIFAIKFPGICKEDCSGRHVQPHGKRLGGKQSLQENTKYIKIFFQNTTLIKIYTRCHVIYQLLILEVWHLILSVESIYIDMNFNRDILAIKHVIFLNNLLHAFQVSICQLAYPNNSRLFKSIKDPWEPWWW